MTRRRFYAIAEIPRSNLSPQDSMALLAFDSTADRGLWVAAEDTSDRSLVQYLMTCGETRRAVTRGEALQIVTALWGGHDPEALQQMDIWPSTTEEAEEADAIETAAIEYVS